MRADFSTFVNSFGHTPQTLGNNLLRNGEDELCPDEFWKAQKQAPAPLITVHPLYTESGSKKLHHQDLQTKQIMSDTHRGLTDNRPNKPKHFDVFMSLPQFCLRTCFPEEFWKRSTLATFKTMDWFSQVKAGCLLLKPNIQQRLRFERHKKSMGKLAYINRSPRVIHTIFLHNMQSSLRKCKTNLNNDTSKPNDDEEIVLNDSFEHVPLPHSPRVDLVE